MPHHPSPEVIVLSNRAGVEVRTIRRGGSIMSIRTPNREGRPADIVLGFDTPDRYAGEHPYFGAIVGRYANRIAHGRFHLEGTDYRLATNDGPHHMHGGRRGFDKYDWEVEHHEGENAVAFFRTSADGEEGYPGTLAVRVAYTLTDASELVFRYEATTDKPTPLNLTQHTYFNLRGHGDVLGHEVWLDADRFVPVDATGIPTGERSPVEGTPFDFREPVAIDARIGADHPQLHHMGGYDHSWVLNRRDDARQVMARACEPSSGRTLEVATDQPGIQFYSGNMLDGSIEGKGGRRYTRRSAFCFETQHFPDSPNQPRFPSTILRPGETYRSTTVYTFGVGA